MDLNKHIVTSDTSKPFHSNGYAKVANGDRLGAAANISFSQRQQIDRNRQIIYGYNRSAIGNAYGISRAKPIIRSINKGTGMCQDPSLQQYNSLNSRPQRSSGPSTQSYDPYA